MIPPREGKLYVIESREVGPWVIASDEVLMDDALLERRCKLDNDMEGRPHSELSKRRESRIRKMEVIP